LVSPLAPLYLLFPHILLPLFFIVIKIHLPIPIVTEYSIEIRLRVDFITRNQYYQIRVGANQATGQGEIVEPTHYDQTEASSTIAPEAD